MRMRAAYHFIVQRASGQEDEPFYISEQTTHFYKQLKKRLPALVGSEYFGEGIPLGSVNARQVRHEDATRLTFEDATFAQYLSFDVLEHIPDYIDALQEAFRVLKPAGFLIFTAPFCAGNEETIVRATVRPDGSIHHLLPEEIHGDPVRKEGALCYYHFGWQILKDLEAVGFKRPGAYGYLSQRYGYLGGPHLIFCAQK
jgi:SAM-dependent methyltransferase